jgi:hypothetical protein
MEEADKDHQLKSVSASIANPYLARKAKAKFMSNLAKRLSANKESKFVSDTLRFSEASFYYFQSFTLYAACGIWPRAAESLNQCAAMNKLLKQNLNAAYLQIQAAEIFMKFDQTEALNSYRSAIFLFCDAGLLKIAAALEEIIGDLHYKNHHWDDASHSEYYICST